MFPVYVNYYHKIIHLLCNIATGSFVFKDVGDGCLIGKWLEISDDAPYPESCKLIPSDIDSTIPFCGKYKTTWIQGGNTTINGTIEITRKNNNVYTIIWNADIKYTGNGMLYDGLLIGSYQSR